MMPYDNTALLDLLDSTLKSLEKMKVKIGDENMITELKEVKGWENQEVKCIGNYGFEDNFELGVTYLCVEDDYDADKVIYDRREIDMQDIKVLDMTGRAIVVERNKFKLAKEM